jgi:hypothetical protein
LTQHLLMTRVKEALLAEQVAQRGKIPEMFGKLAKAFVVPGGLRSLMKGDETVAPVMPGQPVGYERTEDGGVREVPGVPFNDVPTSSSGDSYPGMPTIDTTGVVAYPCIRNPRLLPADLVDFGGVQARS